MLMQNCCDIGSSEGPLSSSRLGEAPVQSTTVHICLPCVPDEAMTEGTSFPVPSTDYFNPLNF